MNTHDAWEQIHRNKLWGGYPTEHVIRFVARNYYKTDRYNVKILDFGCGTGAHTWYLSREGFDTYAFDISETAIKRLQDKMESEHLAVNARVMDGKKLEYPNDYFDAVIDNVSIWSNRIADIKIMYKNVYDVLKNEGKFLTVVFDRETTGYGTGKYIEAGTYEGIENGRVQGIGVRHFFDEEELRNILTETGFKNITIDTIKYTDLGDTVKQLVAIGVK